ncbi:23S ribosomal RNA methyltransferase Erm [Microbacterium murale]|uniref:23S rRNA (Adenine-N6)-dimethyltransferase n=1 Tax=Microbacterium murale TaxID=1081040 RepID=A0ABU0PBW5_9MICO|nr:23S ribosomal RNA methyltransferase Erm [Microbacterium murale]MDQ0644407.1 23S rRNA (adenine-N6)-dimethyltransferase [Microbacterium murale]
MRPRSHTGGRHELGQNFLIHRPTLQRITTLTAATDGPILEIGAGDGALTRHLARLGRDLRAIDIDVRRVDRLRSRVHGASIHHADAMHEPLTRPVIVGNIPFHLTTPLLRRLMDAEGWQHAILLTQWEVARKRAGVGGATMMTAQAGPWYTFRLHDRVPARHFRPMPAVDGGILSIERRASPLIDHRERRRFERFVGAVFRSPGNGIRQILRGIGHPPQGIVRALGEAGVARAALPRDLSPAQWACLWRLLDEGVRRKGGQ